ncbi:phage terminase large subunit [Lelliottia sp. SL45]|uniref:phage terminase large subunit n=1 Tax=Lelliottia sp. SL45 TaxID=2994665 RepID=UPI00227678A8|nr:phage terminase large subunit [Lelliottia sp. SL45]MCY1697154.1 phage terminase large subunit [Lelliottia sp. SL45]
MPESLFSNRIARENVRLRLDAQARNDGLREQVDTETAERDAARAERMAKARTDFAFFCQEYMPAAFPTPFADYQLALARTVSTRTLSRADEHLFRSLTLDADHAYIVGEQSQYEGILDIEPRDHGKTTRNTQAMPLWLALNFPGSFIVICAASQDAAQDMMDGVKKNLEDDEVIIEDYGEQKVRGNKWAARKIQLANGSAIAAVGAGQSLRGIKNKYQRPTHIICDDLLKDEDVDSPVMRKKLYRWFKRVILNLGKGALTIVANTIMHPEDLPSQLLKEIAEGKLEDWLGLRFGALTPDGKALWPDRWPLSVLLKKKKQLGDMFDTEWMNQPVPESEKAFHEEDIHYWQPRDFSLADCDIVMGVDPATGQKKGDYSAITITAKHRATGVVRVLFSKGWRESDLAFARRICDVYRLHHPTKVFFESVAFQAIYKREVMREASRQSLRIPMVEFKGGNKEMRIRSLAPLVENGIVQLSERGQEMLKEQLLAFPRGHDDCPDSLEMCVSAHESRFVGGAPVKSQPVSSGIRQLSRFVKRFGRTR